MKGIIFDIDGTMLDTEKQFYIHYRERCEMKG